MEVCIGSGRAIMSSVVMLPATLNTEAIRNHGPRGLPLGGDSEGPFSYSGPELAPVSGGSMDNSPFVSAYAWPP